MAQRKGWNELSDNYRKRLLRGGITEQRYNTGASLKAARGHKTPTGIGEKAYANLLNLAKAVPSWPRDIAPKTFVDDELIRGTDPRWLRDRLKTKGADTREYRTNHNPLPGRQHWQRRRHTVSVELYWYH